MRHNNIDFARLKYEQKFVKEFILLDLMYERCVGNLLRRYEELLHIDGWTDNFAKKFFLKIKY